MGSYRIKAVRIVLKGVSNLGRHPAARVNKMIVLRVEGGGS
jgi:hypothetical protein